MGRGYKRRHTPGKGGKGKGGKGGKGKGEDGEKRQKTDRGEGRMITQSRPLNKISSGYRVEKYELTNETLEQYYRVANREAV